jgi:predicted GIY-YIG superfamily endonuclease
METGPLNTTNIYVLKLKDDCWYVGRTSDVPKRIRQHFTQNGSAWTTLHKPIVMEACFRDASPFDEDRYTKEYMLKYGIDKVRGGSYVTPYISEEQRRLIQRELWGVQDLCFHCGQSHYVRDCPSKFVDKGSEADPLISSPDLKTTIRTWIYDKCKCIYGYIMDFLLIPPQGG